MNRIARNRRYMLWFYLFLGSFVAGVIIMNMGNELLLTENGIFSAAAVNRLKYIEIDSGRFFRYVLKNRMGEGAVLILLSSTGIGVISVYGYIVWQGIMAGMTITAAIMRFGVKGFLFLLGAFFPHQLLLIPAGVMLLGWCYENSSRAASHYSAGRKQQILRQGITLIWIMLVAVVGCILESYVNPIFLSDLIKIF